MILNDGTAAAGSFVTCRVGEAHAYDLIAAIVPPAEAGSRLGPPPA